MLLEGETGSRDPGEETPEGPSCSPRVREPRSWRRKQLWSREGTDVSHTEDPAKPDWWRQGVGAHTFQAPL